MHGSGTASGGIPSGCSIGVIRFCVMMLLWAISRPDWAASAPHVDLDITVDPAARTIAVDGTLAIARGEAIRLLLTARSEVKAFELDGRPVRPVRQGTGLDGMLVWQLGATPQAPAQVRFRYAIAVQPLDPALDHRQVLGLSQPLASVEGVFLPASSCWYPQPQSLETTYRASISVPRGYRAVIPGKLVDESLATNGTRAVFESREPLPGIDLMAGPYVVAERMLELQPGRVVRLRTYFHPELQSSATDYLDSAARYLARYDRQIGAYAYSSYSIVSAPLPTGFGMPGIAYLGRQVIRLPFIRATSLGHEVLHDWWGNGVYPDYAKGNWSEGLTTFLADYAFKEEEGAQSAQGARLGWLRDYAAVPAEQDRPLSTFVSRRHGADQAVGYNKTAFVFFMLRDLVGEERFAAALRAFWERYRGRVAGWAEIRHEFETLAQRDLDGFFEQWVQRAGAPALRIVSARRHADADRERVRIGVSQRAPAYRLKVPLRVYLDDGTAVDALLALDDVEGHIDVPLPRRAVSVSIDPDVRLFRRLDREETAPILRQVMLDARTRVVASSEPKVRKIAMTLAEATLEHGARPFESGAQHPGPPLLIVGLHVEIAGMLARLGLPPVPDAIKAAGGAYAYAWRTDDGRDFAVVSALDPSSLAALARPLPHLGAQSYVMFEGARSTVRGIWPRSAPRTAVEAR